MQRSRLFVISVLLVLLFVSQFAAVHAVEVDSVFGNCRVVALRGETTVPASKVRVAVHRVSDFALLGETVSRTWRGQFSSVVYFTQQAHGTRLVIVVGEWDGQQYIQPAQLLPYDCGIEQPMPPSDATPTFTPTPFVTNTPTPVISITPSPVITVSGTPIPATPTLTPSPISPTPVSPTPISPTPVSPTPFPSRTPTFVPSPTNTLPPTPTQYP